MTNNTLVKRRQSPRPTATTGAAAVAGMTVHAMRVVTATSWMLSRKTPTTCGSPWSLECGISCSSAEQSTR